MTTNSGLFETEKQGDTLIVTPLDNLSELHFEQINAEAEEILSLVDRHLIKRVILDFSNTDYFGSSALAVFVRLWKRLCAQDGCMAFCNLSAHQRQILEITRLSTLWPISNTREEALAAVRA